MREHVWGPLGMDDTHVDSRIELIPNRVRGYRKVDSAIKTGELFLMNGDTAQAISFYRTAVAVGPDFENAKRVLQKLGAQE